MVLAGAVTSSTRQCRAEERKRQEEGDPLGVYMTLLAAPSVGDNCSFHPLNVEGWIPFVSSVSSLSLRQC